MKKIYIGDLCNKFLKTKEKDFVFKMHNVYKEEYLYKDIYTIVEMLDKEMAKKIDPEFMEFIKENMDEDYESKVNPLLPLKDQELRPELRLVLSLMYINYFCDVEEKESILKFDKVLIDEYDLKVKDVFYEKDKKKEDKKDSEEVGQLEVKQKSGFFSKIINKIKNIFKKNK